MERSKAESFTAYLEARQKERAAPAAPPPGATSLSLLETLAAVPQQALPLAVLQMASGMGFGEFSQAIKRLEDTGYLTISGEPGHEAAQVTRLGSEVVGAIRPD